ncbi:hypothetical protein PENSTE_c024G07417 [Penicillium steckii]|uniref:Uncharacterized protein n=1 Tax=Penicillium steckii TaxID=303698 RepID=A0A1V6SQP8_9EURO|nr:hypothetical protein PENSTE_c024G07417 [Penicillium steckii]
MASSPLKYTTKLANQRILVLGATSGIGFCVAEAAIEHGAHLIISSSKQSNLDRTIARLKESYPSQIEKQPITSHACDLSDAANLDTNLKSLFEAATNGGTTKLNHVVTTAGDTLSRPTVDEITPEIIYSAMNVRFIAPAMMAKYFKKYVESSPTSSFTVTTGVRAHKPAPGWSVVTGMASGVEGLVRGLAIDLKPVRVNAVSPGAVHTELFSQFPDVESVLDIFRKGSITGTVGRPEDLAESYIYVMKDHFVTGTVIESNGGALLV